MLPGLKGVNDVKNLKVFCSYFIPCFIIFCVPTIVLCSFCFSVLIHEFKNTAYEETQTTLQRSLDEMENKITQIQNAGIQFSQLPLPMEDLDKNILSRMEVIDSLRELMSFSSSQCTEIVFWIPETSMYDGYMSPSIFRREKKNPEDRITPVGTKDETDQIDPIQFRPFNYIKRMDAYRSHLNESI